MEYARGFKGVWIPADIWLDPRLTVVEKGLLAEIESLDNEHGCHASNEHFEGFLGVSAATVKRAIVKLIDLGLIRKAGFYKRCRVLKVIHKAQNELGDLAQNEPSTRLKMSQEPSSKRATSSTGSSPESSTKDIVEIVNYLNGAVGKSFRPNNRATQRLIRARLKEGYCLEDFQAVIDAKARAWKGSEQMRQYLRPSTLFAPSHFEEYLVEAMKAPKQEYKPRKIERPTEEQREQAGKAMKRLLEDLNEDSFLDSRGVSQEDEDADERGHDEGQSKAAAESELVRQGA